MPDTVRVSTHYLFLPDISSIPSQNIDRGGLTTGPFYRQIFADLPESARSMPATRCCWPNLKRRIRERTNLRCLLTQSPPEQASLSIANFATSVHDDIDFQRPQCFRVQTDHHEREMRPELSLSRNTAHKYRKNPIKGSQRACDPLPAAGSFYPAPLRLAPILSHTARFASASICGQAMISSIRRAQPTHSPSAGSMRHSRTQGEGGSSSIAHPANHTARPSATGQRAANAP